MSAFGMSYEEQKKRGEEIYNAQIRHLISDDEADKYVNIDVISGDYEMHENSATAGRILRERRPDAVIHTIHRHKSYIGRLRTPRYISLSRSAQ